jgi:hypothetical protein
MVRKWLHNNKGKGRLALARHLCEELDLKDRSGKPRLAGVQKALRVLEAMEGAGNRGGWIVRFLSPAGCRCGWSKSRGCGWLQ